jgi:hypothetical protein
LEQGRDFEHPSAFAADKLGMIAGNKEQLLEENQSLWRTTSLLLGGFGFLSVHLQLVMLPFIKGYCAYQQLVNVVQKPYSPSQNFSVFF